ncbi:MAG: tyrosine-type recombinase/integrase [bacterium]
MKIPEKYMNYTFSSPISESIEKFIIQQRAVGFIFNDESKSLRSFDRFVSTQICPPNTLSKEIVNMWIDSRPNEKPTTQRKRANLIKLLGQFMLKNGYEAYIPPITVTRAIPPNYIPYIFTDEELARLFSATDHLPHSTTSNRSLIAPVFFRMLYGCGLRESEGRKLRIRDVDLEKGTLAINDTKLGKSRLIPMAPSLLQRCKNYSYQIHGNSNAGDFFFSPPKGGMYSRGAFLGMFHESLRIAKIPYGGKGKGPRMHDLRHTFAVHCLRKWVQNGTDITTAFPYLSVYMGHCDLRSSQYYLRLTSELFEHITDSLNRQLGDIIPKAGDVYENN